MTRALNPIRMAAATAALTVFFAGCAWLSTWPVYQQIPTGSAVIKLSFTHGADRSSECRRLSPEELAKLPPNMRKPISCPRERRPLVAEFEIDGIVAFAETLPPTGLSGDGPSRVYRRFVVPAGAHRLAARLRDTPRADGFDHTITRDVTLSQNQSLAIDFRPELGGFIIR